MAAGAPQQPGNGLFGHLGQAGGRPYATAFIEMVDDLCGFALWELRVEQRCPASLRKFLTAATTSQQPQAITTVHLPDDEIVVAALAKEVAVRIDTGSSGEVGAFHEVLPLMDRSFEDFIRSDGSCQPLCDHPRTLPVPTPRASRSTPAVRA